MKTNLDISAMQYMRAHGNSVGPTHRPLLTGLLSGAVAAIPSLAIRAWSGALSSEAHALGINVSAALLLDIVVLAASGVAYSLIFRRAAYDICGGWLLGISFGFLLWVIGPITIWDWVSGKPVATGAAAMGMFASQLAYGITLGGTFPLVNRITESKLN